MLVPICLLTDIPVNKLDPFTTGALFGQVHQ